MNANRKRAKRLMVHYFRTLFWATDERWDDDTAAEVEDIVDCMIDAAKEEISEAMFGGFTEPDATAQLAQAGCHQ